MIYEKKLLDSRKRWQLHLSQVIPIWDHPQRISDNEFAVHIYPRSGKDMRKMLIWAESKDIQVRIEGSDYNNEDSVFCIIYTLPDSFINEVKAL